MKLQKPKKDKHLESENKLTSIPLSKEQANDF